MEAADDISYCLSDIEDGIEKKVFSPSFFFEKLLEEYNSSHHGNLSKYQSWIKNRKSKEEFYQFKIMLIRELESFAAKNYIANEDLIFQGH